MSRSGQLSVVPAQPVGAVFVARVDLDRGDRYDWHTHAEHQLAWAARGVLSVGTADGTWVLPATRALWLPAGTAHALEAASATAVRSLYFRAASCPVGFGVPTAVAVDRLLAALVVHLARADLPDDARLRAEAVVFDLLVPASAGVVLVPLPRDPRARWVADALSEDPADQRDLAAWARHAGASPRTLARLFAAETGMSFGRWRTQVRMRAALGHLAGGMPVTAVARRVGYATPSAFVAVFRRTFGVTPGTYFGD